MPRTFPIPREHIPRLDVPESEHHACRRFMKRMLAHTMREFEAFTYRDKLAADRARWKQYTSQNELSVFRERESGATSKQLLCELGDCLETQPALLSKTRAALATPTLLLSGVGHGRVENAMEAVVTQSQQELALVVTFMHEQVADCAVVHTMEPPNEEEPFRFLGFKYFVKRSPTDPRIIKHRSSLYLESTGMTTSSSGERLGFHLMHSVRLPRFPDLSGHHSIEALQSIRYIYRQRSDKLVEVFALANMDLAGRIARPLSNLLVVGAITGVVRLLDLAEARRLTDMARQRENNPEFRRTSTSSAASSGSASTSKRVFYGDEAGVMGEFRKVTTCMACVAIANASRKDFQLATRSRSPAQQRHLSSVSSRLTRTTRTPETVEKPRRRSPRMHSGDHKSAKTRTVRARRRDQSSATGVLERAAASSRGVQEARQRVVAKTSAAMELRPASAPSPSLAQSSEAADTRSPPAVGLEQRRLWMRLQQLHVMAESTDSLTQRNGAAMLGRM